MTIAIALVIACIFSILVLSAVANDRGEKARFDSEEPFSDSSDRSDRDRASAELEPAVQERPPQADNRAQYTPDRLPEQIHGQLHNEGLWGDGT